MSMNFELLLFDYLVLGMSIIFIFFAIWKGFINSILSLLSWIGSIFITIISYEIFSFYITTQITNINFFSNFQTEVQFVITILSIIFIFLISLFVLKRIRRFLSSDLDRQIFGKIIDKFFGILYGLVFSYIFFSIILYFTDDFQMLNFINEFLNNNSNILNEIEKINIKIIGNYKNINTDIN